MTRWSTAHSKGCWSKGRGTRAAWCCSETQSTRPRRISGKARALRSRTVWCWPRNWPTHDTVGEALAAYRERRFERCAYIVRASLAICMGQLGKGPPVDNAKATAEMFERVAQPI